MEPNDLGLIGGGIFTAAVATIIAVANIRGPRPVLSHPWALPPTVRVVVGGVDGCTEGIADLVEECAAAWTRHGLKVEAVRRGLTRLPDGRELRDDAGAPLPDYGAIVVCFGAGADSLPLDHEGRTTYNAYGDGTDWAICRIRTPTRHVILHELGHALGYRGHVSKRGHVMASTLDRVGDSFAGIPKR